MSQFRLTFTITSDWHIGNGKAAGAYADALVLKDHNGLPYLPGKSVKGLLRQAFSTAADNQWFGENSDRVVTLLFGSEDRAGDSKQGIIQISSARLSDAETQFFIRTPGAGAQLYRVISSTAINHETGVAENGSLRSMEVAIPMTLTALLTLNDSHPAFNEFVAISEDFADWLGNTVALIYELGAKRHRGLGQVEVTAEQIKGA
ncbi:MAG: hypothetical protein CSB48_13845 [Proteobacteria bacterium]|nr:MAG: hypothetical protein CSB48_13845 [Pseudomonadota bacterium]